MSSADTWKNPPSEENSTPHHEGHEEPEKNRGDTEGTEVSKERFLSHEARLRKPLLRNSVYSVPLW
jgi:hypothetical protein